MGNPARELARLLQSWRMVGATQDVYVARDGSNPGDIVFWREQAHAAELMTQVDRFIESLATSGKHVSYYEASVVSWYRGVFAPDLQWSGATGVGRQVVPQSAVHLLFALADTIDANTAGTELPLPMVKTITSSLDEILGLLSDGQIGLDPKTKRYAFELIMSLRRVMNETDAFGSTDLLARVNELFGFLTLLADELSADPANDNLVQKLRVAARKIIPLVRFSTGFALGALGGAADVAQITSVINPATGAGPA